MNRNHIILPLVALALAALSACQSDQAPPAPQTEAKAVEIPVSQIAVKPTETRALGPIDGLSYNEIYVAYAESAPGAYLTDPYYLRALKALVTYGISVFQPLLFYPNAGGVCNNIYLRAFYPREGVTDFIGSNSEIRAISSNKVHYQINGQHDLLLSSVVRGHYYETIYDQYEDNGRIGPISEGARLRFEHLLSRVSFRVARAASWPETLKLNRIWITKLSDRATLNLSKAVDDADVLVFDAADDKEFLVYENTDGLLLPTGSSAVLGEAMIEPGGEFEVQVEFSSGEIVTITEIKANQYTINILGDDVDNATYHDIVKRGYKYEIRLTFGNLGITTTVAAQPWVDVTVGDETGWW